jgi:hypothetical protein
MTDSKTPDWVKEEAEKAMLDSPICMIPTADWDAAVLLISQALLSAYERGKAEREWQDISTAPKDGTLILVSFGSKGVRAVAWDSPHYADVTPENGIWCVDDDKHGPYPLRGYNNEGHNAPTKWMPLPAPPAIRQLLEVKG